MKVIEAYEGLHVKCVLRNNTIVEGTVLLWGKSAQLQSLDGKSILIIHDVQQDIVMTKVLLSVAAEEPAESEEIVHHKPAAPVAATLEEACQLLATEEPEDSLALRAKSVAELKIELAKQEREIFSKKLREHQPNLAGTPRKVAYEYPKFFKK